MRVYVNSNSRLRCCGVSGHLSLPGHSLQSSDMQLLLPGCPFCRKVREAITLLDLDVMIYPCPKGAVSWLGLLELCSSISQPSLQRQHQMRGYCAHCRWYHLPQQGHANERQEPIPIPRGLEHGYEPPRLACGCSC